MREASLKHLRGGGSASTALPVTVTIYKGSAARVTDGRHRITIARERGQRSIVGTVIVRGPRGGEIARETGRIKI